MTKADPDLPYLRNLVETNQIEPYQAIYAVVEQLTQTKIDGVTPSFGDPEMGKLLAACIEHSADDLKKLTSVLQVALQLVAVFA